MKARQALIRYGYIILMLRRYQHGRWEYVFETYRREETAERALHSERGGFWTKEFVTISEAKKHGFQPEPAFFWDEYYEKEG